MELIRGTENGILCISKTRWHKKVGNASHLKLTPPSWNILPDELRFLRNLF